MIDDFVLLEVPYRQPESFYTDTVSSFPSFIKIEPQKEGGAIVFLREDISVAEFRNRVGMLLDNIIVGEQLEDEYFIADIDEPEFTGVILGHANRHRGPVFAVMNDKKQYKDDVYVYFIAIFEVEY